MPGNKTEVRTSVLFLGLTEQMFKDYNRAETEHLFRGGVALEPTILLIDMNAFFASVHQALDPGLRGKPVVVCGDREQRRGIVLAASYEAKKYGVKTGMTAWEARTLLPHGIYVRPDYGQYLAFSRRILQIIREYSPLVEPFSIDEAFVDLKGCEGLFGDVLTVAREMKRRIREEVGVTCSVGIGPNKLVAKMAAELEKPDGLTLLRGEDVPRRLWPLPVRELFGVGSRTERKLQAMGIKTIGDLANFPVEVLERRFGIIGRVLHMSANGIDYSPVSPGSLERAKSIGNQMTLPRDYASYRELRAAILELAEMVGRRVRQGGYEGKTVSLTLRDSELHFYSWSASLWEYSDLTEDIYRQACTLLERYWPEGKRVRLVGVGLSKLRPKTALQLDVFGEKLKLERLNQTCDLIRERFGRYSIMRGGTLTEAGIHYGQRK